MKKIFFAVLFLSYGLIPSGRAEAGDLKPGMTFSEVIAIRGAPIEKDDHEISRIVLWRYKDASLRFYEGRLQGSTAAVQKLPSQNIALNANEKQLGKAPKKRLNDTLTQDLVDEIIDSLPNDTGGPQAPTPSAESPFMSSP